MVICVTGAAGNIAYSLIPIIASGQIFGLKNNIYLRLLDIPPMMNKLRGLRMELNDCGYPLLQEVKYGSDSKKMFEGADVVIFVGGFPRKQGMNRSDLIGKNSLIFKEQGIALNEVGKTTSNFCF